MDNKEEIGKIEKYKGYKIEEYDYKDYKHYTNSNWNSFLLRNIFYQIFSTEKHDLFFEKKIIMTSI